MRQEFYKNLDIDLKIIINKLNINKILLVHDIALQYLPACDFFKSLNIQQIPFADFLPNPLYEDVCKGVFEYNSKQCDSIVAIGGGSTIDVAKCIKLFCKMDGNSNYLRQEFTDSGVPLIAIPTTAGTGSESTRYAVIYYEGKKQSITHESIIPDYVVLDPEMLRTLPLYQKKCTMLDALCQGIESWWSVNSTDESKAYSKTAVTEIIAHMDAYLTNPDDMEAAGHIMSASNYAGRAINITQTTAPHAMSYKLTSMYHIPHGHAVAVCLPRVWRYMLAHIENTSDARGAEYLKAAFMDISKCMGFAEPEGAVSWFEELLVRLEVAAPKGNEEDALILAESVNPVRLKNNPVRIDEEDFLPLYKEIIMGEKQ